VILSESHSEIAAVVYWQHAGHYTRIAHRNGFETSGTHPVVYVGKLAHGSYHSPNRGGWGGPFGAWIASPCYYWADYRNPKSPQDGGGPRESRV
jgi:hypothetical protein